MRPPTREKFVQLDTERDAIAMKAMLLTAPGTLDVVDVDDPRIEEPDDVIVRVRAASVCGSDTHGYTGHGGRRVPPLIMGHETSGIVEAVGPAVGNLVPGDRIMIMPAVYCLSCRMCRDGAMDECLNRQVFGADRPGGFAQYMRTPARAVVPIPEAVSFSQASLVEPLAVALKGLTRARIAPGDTVAVVGAGPIGLLSISILSLMGPRQLIAIEPNEIRRAKALELGASATLDPRDPRFADDLAALTDGVGVDVCVEAAGVTSSVAVAVNSTRSGGQLVWLGNAGGVVEINEFMVVWNQLTIYASVGVTKAGILRAIQLIADGATPVERIVALEVPLVDGVDAFHRTARDQAIVKTVIYP